MLVYHGWLYTAADRNMRHIPVLTQEEFDNLSDAENTDWEGYQAKKQQGEESKEEKYDYLVELVDDLAGQTWEATELSGSALTLTSGPAKVTVERVDGQRFQTVELALLSKALRLDLQS